MAYNHASFGRLSISAASSAIAAMLIAAPALAQSQQTAAPAEQTPASASPPAGDIVVTATRRSELLSKVPVAVSVVSGDRLRNSNITNARDLAQIVPTLNFRNTASNKDQSLFIRGLGTVSTSSGVEPSVSTVVDGVALARQGQVTFDLYDVDRIEVLRGPQGTLFGKNASAGALNIVTKTPTNDFHAYGDVFYGTGGDEWRLKAGISGALVQDKIFASINGIYAHYDGNITNVFDGKTVGGYSKKGVRAKFVFLPTDNLTLTLGMDYLRTKDTTPQGVVARTFLTAYPTGNVTNFPAFAAALGPVVASSDNRQVNSNFPSFANDKNGGVSLQADWTLGDYTITSISAYRRWQNTQHQDQTRLATLVAAYPYQHDVGDTDFNQISQEVRLASPKGHFLEFQVGLYYMREDDSETYRRDTTSTTAANTGIAKWGIVDNNYAAFGEATLNFTQRFRAIAGARVIKDDLNYNFNRSSTSAVPVTGIQTAFVSSGSTHPTGYADRIGLQYDVASTAMAYFTYSRGYKGPAYNVAFSMLPQDTGALKPETNNSYEIGLKAHTPDGRFSANLAAFIEDFSNYQVNFFDTYNGSPVTRLINAGAVSSRGVEADVSARPINNLSLTGSAAYTKARIDSFICPPGTAASCQVNGKPLPYTPDWKMNVRANYTIPVGASKVDLTTDYSWQSATQYSINQTPDTIQPAYGIWNAGIAFTTSNGLRLAVIAKNLLNQHYSTNLATFGQGIVRWVPRDDNRYFGFNVRKDF
jgi:iron complex outermembrane receptor protein